MAETDQTTLARWKQLTLQYRNPKLSHYGGHVVSPLIESHPVTGATVMRFLEPVPEGETILNPPSIHIQDMDGAAEAATLREISQAVRDPRHVYAHHWQEGDVVVTDNYSLTAHSRSLRARPAAPPPADPRAGPAGASLALRRPDPEPESLRLHYGFRLRRRGQILLHAGLESDDCHDRCHRHDAGHRQQDGANALGEVYPIELRMVAALPVPPWPAPRRWPPPRPGRAACPARRATP